MQRALLGFLLTICLLMSGQARSEQTSLVERALESCIKSPVRDDCAWFQFGTASPDSVSAQGQELFRMYLSAFHMQPTVYEVRHSKSGMTILSMRQYGEGHGEIDYPLSNDAWTSLVQRWKRFVTEENRFAMQEKVRAEMQEREHPGVQEVTVCTDGYVLSFDLVLDGKVEFSKPETCGHPPVDSFKDEVFTLFMKSVPYCARLASELFELCFKFEGDRYAAAEVAPLLGDVMRLDCKDASRAELVRKVAAAGSRSSGGADMLAPMCAHTESWIVPEIIEGRGNLVTVTGNLQVYDRQAKPTQYREAAFTQAWKRTAGSEFKMVRWDIGPLVPQSAH